jgi:hypothetical protein
MKRTLLYLSLAIVAVGCKKDPLPAPKDDSPVFSFKGYADGLLIDKQAGNDNYYMHASHDQDTSGLYVYQGEIKKECKCDYSLKIRINDVMLSAMGAQMKPDNALHTGPYLLNDVTKYPTTQKVEMVPKRSFSVQETYIWRLQSPNDSSVITNYSITPVLKLGTTYTVILNFDDNVGGCQSKLTSVYKAGSSFQAAIKVAPGSNALSYVFSPEVSGTGPFDYKWEFGDNSQSTLKDPAHVYSTYEPFVVKLTVTKGQESVTAYYQVNTLGDGSCTANFSFNPLPLDFTSVFKTIFFELTDPSGKVYSSKDVEQPSESYAQITEISDYSSNRDGDPTKKLTIRFSCLMKGPDKTIKFTEGNATIAVSYK